MAGESNGPWGALAAHSQEMAEAWDSYARLPDAGENEWLDAFCRRKRISISALVRLGARLSEPTVLAFSFEGGIKYRDILTDKRWAFPESEFKRLKVVTQHRDPAPKVILAEGETDAARLLDGYERCDVAVLPAGALTWKEEWDEQVEGYEVIYVGLDNNAAGDRGAQKIIRRFAQATRFTPTADDWCDTDVLPPLPDPPKAPSAVIVPLGELLELAVPEQTSWFERAVVPVGGLVLIHGPAKMYKSFLAFDLMAAIAECRDWATFEPMEEPARACILQFEIAWPFYRQRMEALHRRSQDPEALRAHLLTYSPLSWPELRAGNKKQEDAIRRNLDSAGVQVVLIDPLRRAMTGADMNAEKDVGIMLKFCETLQRDGRTAIVVHHDAKEKAEPTGSGAWLGHPDTLLGIRLPPGVKDRDQTTQRNLHFTLRNAPHPGNRGMYLTEDAQVRYSTEPFSDQGEDGDPAL